MESSDDVLVDVLDAVDRFFRHLDMYTQIPHSPALDEMVVKIVLELLSVLELATKRLTQGRLSEPILVDLLPSQCNAARFVKNDSGDEGVKVVLQSLDGTTGESRTTETETPEAVHGLVQNVNVVMDGERTRSACHPLFIERPSP